MCPCVCDFVEKRARNYRKRHLSRGKIIKSIHTQKTSWKTLLPALPGSSQCGAPRKTRGDRKSIPVCFSGTRQWENRQRRQRKSARAGKIENFQQRARASSICIWFSTALIFSDFPTLFHRAASDCCYFWCAAQQQVRRLPENSRVPNSLKCSENFPRKITTWERSEKLKCKRRKKSSSQEQVKKCKFFQLFSENFAPRSIWERRKVSLNSLAASKFSRPQLRK